MKAKTCLKLNLIAGVSVLAAHAGAAQAQQAAAAANAPIAAVSEVVVTAQRKREPEQTVPIAITALSTQALKEQKIEGGPDLLRAVPNASFTKTNFSGYNLTIRGIGTQAVAVATDPGVSVNFNGTALIRNNLFEQEFFDVDQVEVLRGPQGTLYGRNATAGAVDVISSKPTDTFEGEIKGEVGNYSSRRFSGYVNVPLIGDKLDLRIAGSSTDRSGYEYNSETGDAIDGRNLYSTRVTLQFKPNDRFKADLVWEHFDESDNRARSTKQLCTRDPGPSSVGGVQNLDVVASAYMSQGCQDASLYSPAAYGTPNGLSLPFVLAGTSLAFAGWDTPYSTVPLLKAIDPYGGLMQSPNLREIASSFDPRYRASSDVTELNADYEVTPHLTLTSQTAYDGDKYFSTEDYNRFATVSGIFNDSNGLLGDGGPGPAPSVTPGGVYCDPQLGCSSSIEGVDESKATSRQISQELRLQSSFEGPFNFSLGANYTYYHTVENYYVFFNLLSALSQSEGAVGNDSGNVTQCGRTTPPTTITPHGNTGCIYIDPNTLSNVNNLGHNYYLNQNPYTLNSAAAFGEVYYKITPTLKLTGGFRYTDDNKNFTPIPTQLLLSSSVTGGGTVDGGYPALTDIKQHWGALTGRLGLDWSPQLSFTNQTLIYAFYNHGYKGGGANPPSPGVAANSALLTLQSYPATFAPEYVNSFEVGTKNALLGGTLILNADAFYYDYTGYQVSQIENDTEINQNFNAKVWGAEFQSVWQATHHLRFDLNLGYEGTRLDKGSQSIDVMNRTQGNPDYTVLKPFPDLPNNCTVSTSYVAKLVAYARETSAPDETYLSWVCPGSIFNQFLQYFPFGAPTAADLPNHGQGFYANLSGHNLPNAPEWTQTLGAEYSQSFGEDWKATLRGDVYHQSNSWARVYEDPIDKLHGWYNVNLRLTVAKPGAGLEFEVYVKNLLNVTPITGAYINSDNTGLTANVFTLDPRVIGGSITKKF
jgi:outer membrane receptor protein involved in Fe transport